MKNMKKYLFSISLITLLASCNPVTFQTNEKSTDKPADPACNGDKCTVNVQSTTWSLGDWTMCDKPCGGGAQSRHVQCLNQDNVAVPDDQCSGAKPNFSQSCNLAACTSPDTWNAGNWGTCSVTCGGGTQNRSVFCQDSQGNQVADNQCTDTKPATSQVCNTQVCPQTAYWDISAWGACSKTCEGGTRMRTVVCKQGNVTVDDANCSSLGTKPTTSETCNTQSCSYNYVWVTGDFGTCTKTCGTGLQQRSVTCRRDDGVYVDGAFCPPPKPADMQNCNFSACPPDTKTINETKTVTPGSAQVDILLVVDDSSSMAEDNTKLANRLINFVNQLQDSNVDWRMCVTTTDVDYYEGRPLIWSGAGTHILTRNVPNLDTVFTKTIYDIGSGYSNDEQGIKAMNLSVLSNSKYGCYRPQAGLAVVLISDENERSVGGNQSWSYAQYKPLTDLNYPSSFINTVANTFNTATFTKKLTVNSIIVKDKTCEAIQDAQGTPSFQGTLYEQLSEATGGHVGSICDNDFSSNLQYSAIKIVNSLETLTLQCTPIAEPTVTVNPPVAGLVTTRDGVTLRFNPLLPENTTVQLQYTCLK